MSGRCTGWVLKHGPRERAMRSVLIVIADAANADGEHSHPGLTTIIESSLYGRSTVLDTLRLLEDDKWIRVSQRSRRGQATVYDVLMDRPPNDVQPLDPNPDDDVQTLDPIRPDEVQSPDPNEEQWGPVETPMGSNPASNGVQSSPLALSYATVTTNGVPNATPATSSPRGRVDPLWDAVMDASGVEGKIPRSARGAYNRAVAELREVGATPDDVAARAARYRAEWPQAALTPSALSRHWGELAGGVRAGPPAVSRSLANVHRVVERVRAISP